MTTKTLVQELKELVGKVRDMQNENFGYNTDTFEAVGEILDLLEPILVHTEQKAAEDEKHRLTEDEFQIINLELGVGVSHVIRDKLRHWSKGKMV